MADYARLLIAKIIHDGDLSSPLTSGVMEEWFEDDEHQVFSWMLEYLDRYSQTPTLAAFRHQFPVYKLPPVEEPIDYYIDQFRDQRKRTLLVDAIISADDALKQGDSNSAESRLSHGLSQIQQEMAALTASEDRWPVLNEAALYGLPGEVVALFDPHTEADPVAILTTFWPCLGRWLPLLSGKHHMLWQSQLSTRGASTRCRLVIRLVPEKDRLCKTCGAYSIWSTPISWLHRSAADLDLARRSSTTFQMPPTSARSCGCPNSPGY